MVNDGEVVVPITWPKVLADLLVAVAQVGFTFRVETKSDTWVVRLSR